MSPIVALSILPALIALVACSEPPPVPPRSAIATPAAAVTTADSPAAVAAPSTTVGPLIGFHRHDLEQDQQAVYVAALDGTAPRRVAAGLHPALSPDGTRLAIVDKFAIAIVDVASGAEIAKVPDAIVWPLTWSHDGAKLLLRTTAGTGWVGRDGGNVTPVVTPENCHGSTWGARDERFYCVVVDAKVTIQAHAADGQILQSFTLPRALGVREPIQCWLAAARTRDQLALGCDFDDENPDGRLYLIDMATRRGRRLTTSRQYAVLAVWLPDDGGLLVGLAAEDKDHQDIVRMDLETGATSILVERAFGPTASW